MPHQLTVTLTNDERTTLETFIHRGKANARTLTRARILLKSAEGWSTSALVAAFDVCEATVTNVRKRFTQGGLEAVLHDKVQQHRRSALSGLQTAHLIAIACSPSPDAHDHWTVRLLAQKAVELGFVTSISPNTIHEMLKKNELKPWQHEHWCLPSVGGEFVAAMEDVLDLYEEPYDPQYPTICLDEKPVILHADVHPPVPVEPGKPERIDYEYERKGTRNLFVMVEPLAGWRHVEVTMQRTMQDYARVVRFLVDEVYPHAEYIRLVQDNLNTHTSAALYETFPPSEARRILQRVEFHYTPKHGSWLNMAEIEIAILERNALSRRLCRVLAVETERNRQRRGIAWQFTSRDARVKLERLYPVKERMLD
ncbi:IS630 family transposase [Ktedonobacter racemifer]|nr:IS630 family transposase [Ktedonobacter racemifer]